MNTIIAFLQAHSTIASLVAYYIAISFVGSLPAPQANSSQFYQFVFKFANTLSGNLSRAYATRVEGSPNFAAAVNLANAQSGETKVVVPVPAEPPKP